MPVLPGILANGKRSPSASAATIRNEIGAPAAEQAVAFVDDRSELLASTGNVIFMHGDAGGWFVLSDDQASASDNVLRITRTDGTILERVWDGVNFFAEWVPLNVAVGSFTPIVSGDKLRAAVDLMPSGATLHLADDAEYLVELPMRYTRNLKIDGHGSTIKRADQRASLLTANSNSGTSTVTVADGTQFRTGMRAFVVKSAGVLGGHAMVNGTTTLHSSVGFTITNINGNAITLGGTLQQNCVIGDKLVALDYMLLCDDIDARLEIVDAVFDGNSSQHSDVLDWAAGGTMAVKFAVIERCKFKNTPNENINGIAAGRVANCTGTDLWGSFVHVSSGDQDYADGLVVDNCRVTSSCTKNNGHDEGVVTFSNTSINVRVTNCVFDNSSGTKGMGVIGKLDSVDEVTTDGNIFVSNVKAFNFASIMTLEQGVGTQLNFDRVVLVNCYFETCGVLWCIGSAVAKSPYINELTVSQCEFVNCWVRVGRVRTFNWLNNVYRWKLWNGCFTATSETFAGLPTTRIDGSALANGDAAYLTIVDGANPVGIYIRSSGAWVYDATATSHLPSGSSVAGALWCYDCGRVKIHGGSLEGLGFMIGTSFRVGINFTQSVMRKIESATTTVAYCEMSISDLVVADFVYAIGHRVDSQWSVVTPFDVNNWTFSNITVYTARNPYHTVGFGIEVPAGCVAENCKVFVTPNMTSSATTAIKLQGPIDPTKTVGGIAKGCYVPFCPGSSQAIRFGITTDNARNANCIAINNLVAKAPAMAGSYDKIDQNNLIVSSATLAGMTAQEQQPFRVVGANETLY